MPALKVICRKIDVVCLVAVLAIGIFFRLPPATFSNSANPLHAIEFLHPQPKWTQMGFLGVDEGLYRGYVNELIETGLSGYPDIVLHYLEVQKDLPGSILPPVRFLYIFSAYVWHSLFGSEALTALKSVASFFSILTLALSAAFVWRIKGPAWSLAVTSLCAVAPTQIHMSQHALVDGFFTFWALLCLWMLWENLRAPRDWRWLVSYIFALCCAVLTKENSFFLFVGIVTLLVVNHWLRFGTVGRELVVATVLGPLLGVVILVFLAGGIDVLLATYRLSVSKNMQLPYAILTGDGPWYRYILDLLLVSPVIVILAIGAIFCLDRTKNPELFMSIFVAATYLIMCNIKYGMNLRYANMWDMPLRLLAFSQIVILTSIAKGYRVALTSVVVLLICAVELRQYYILFVDYPLYELPTHLLMRALQILKYSDWR